MSDPQFGPALRRLASKVAAIRPSGDVEAAVMAEFDRVYIRRRPRKSVRFLPIGGALAASLAAALLLLRPAPQAGPEARAVETPAFYPIPYTAPLEPYERVMVVETSVPVSQLIAAGFRVPGSDPGGSVRADVMVGQDGRARAIRPVVFHSGGVR